MPSRDPTTGQFTSGAANSEYRDHEFQHVRATFRDNDVGANSAYTISDLVEVDIPADRRREEAELVCLNVHNARVEIDEAEVTDGDGIRAGWEISRDEDPGPLTQFRTEKELANNAHEGTSPGAGALSRQSITDDHDTLWFALLRGEAGGGGRVNARGGPWYQNYRELTGTGPTFSGGDALHVHARQNSVARASNFVADIQFTAIWSVTDRS